VEHSDAGAVAWQQHIGTNDGQIDLPVLQCKCTCPHIPRRQHSQAQICLLGRKTARDRLDDADFSTPGRSNCDPQPRRLHRPDCQQRRGRERGDCKKEQRLAPQILTIHAVLTAAGTFGCVGSAYRRDTTRRKIAANGNEPKIERLNSACLRHVSVGLAQRGSLARRRQRSARIPPTLAPCSSRRDIASATTMSPDFATCRCLFVARRGRPLLRRVSNAGVIVLLLALAGCGPSPSHLPERSSTAWAYPMSPPCSVSRTSCRARYSISGARSRVSFSSNEKKNLFLAPDW
jgi:hypothetical protein